MRQLISYRYRPSLLGKEARYDLVGRSLACSDGRVLDFADIDCIRVYDTRDIAGMGSSALRCVIRPAHGRPLVLVSISFLGIGRFEDRRAEFQAFVDALIKQVAAANPRTRFISGMPVALWCLWAFALGAAAVTMPLTMASLLLGLVGDSAIAAVLVAVAGLAAMAFLLFYFLYGLRTDWPRSFDPRATKQNAI